MRLKHVVPEVCSGDPIFILRLRYGNLLLCLTVTGSGVLRLHFFVSKIANPAQVWSMTAMIARTSENVSGKQRIATEKGPDEFTNHFLLVSYCSSILSESFVSHLLFDF